MDLLKRGNRHGGQQADDDDHDHDFDQRKAPDGAGGMFHSMDVLFRLNQAVTALVTAKVIRPPTRNTRDFIVTKLSIQ